MNRREIPGGAAVPLSDRACAAFCLAFALWTLLCHAVVAAGGSLRQLIAVAGTALAAVLGYALWRRSAAVPRAGGADEVEPPPDPRPRWRWAAQGLGLALGLAGVAAFLGSGDPILCWWWTLAVLAAAALVFLLGEAPECALAVGGRAREAALWALSALCVVLTLVTHRPDLDDAFYVNLAISAADFPGEALLAVERLHGIPGLPLHLAVYKLHSFELLNGALSYLTGIPAIYSFHWVAATGAAILVPLAHAALFRQLTPRIWPWSVLALVVVLVASAETHRWYSNFGVVRMWQGKAVFLFVMMPLVYAYALRFARRPSVGFWLLLCSAQVGAVGCTSSALWAAPAGALAALAAVLRPNRAGLRTFFLGASASAYVLLVGWLIKGQMYSFNPMGPLPMPGSELVGAVIEVMGQGRLLVFALAVTAGAWALCPPGLGQRFAIALPLAVLVVLLNPYTDLWIRTSVTGPSYWRSLWALPVPILMSLALVSPLHLGRSRGARIAGAVACLATLAAFAAWVPRIPAISERNGGVGVETRIGHPGLKVPPDLYRWAAAVNDAVEPGDTVLAPPMVSFWITTFHHHAHPVEVRQEYLAPHGHVLGQRQLQDRHVLTLYVGGDASHPGASSRFRRGLDRYDVKAVCLAITARTGEARGILRAAGFHRKAQGTDHELWVRS